MSNWEHLSTKDFGWNLFEDKNGRETNQVRTLYEGNQYIWEVSLKANYKAESHWHPYDIIQIFLEGEFKSEGEGSFYPGDIRWVKAGQSTIESGGSEGSRFYLIALGGNIPLMWDDLYEVPEDLKKTLQGRGSGVGKANINKLPFIPFEDEYGRPTQPVQVICNESPHIVRTTFDPTYTASDHWHKHDTMYFIMDGEMSFSDDEPIYKKGDVRVVKGGYSYGPEKPGKEGVTFILISNGGPIDLNWSDIKKPPLVN